MKAFQFFCLSMLITCTTFAQVKKDVIGKYYWKNDLPIYPCNLDGTNLAGGTPTISKANQVFTVIDKISIGTTDYAILIIGNYDERKTPQEFFDYNFRGTEAQRATFIGANPNTQSNGNFQRYFKITVDDLNIAATKYSYIGGGLAGGIINFPFKLRLQGGGNDFSSFNLGAAAGYSFGHYDYRTFTHSILFAASASNINLDAASVNKNPDKLATTNNFTALTFAFGWLVTYDKFQAGAFLGFDRLGSINNDTFDWKYQNKPWLSIGFGYSIFSVQKEKSDDSTQKQP